MADPILDRPISPRQLVDALQTDPTLGLSSLDQHYRPLTAPDDNPFHRKKLMSRPSTWMESSANPGETGSSGWPSPRALKIRWREEQQVDGQLMPRAQTPRSAASLSRASSRGGSVASDGAPLPTPVERRLTARLSSMHTRHMQAAALANQRGLELEELRAKHASAAYQLQVLRDSREGLSSAVGDLEKRLRKEAGRGDKLRRHYDGAMRAAADASAAEAEPRASAHSQADQYEAACGQIAELQLRRQRQEAAMVDVAAERDEARQRAATLLEERDAALASVAESRTTIAELDEAREKSQVQLEQAKMTLIDEREARRAKESERVLAVEAAEKATNKMEAALKQLERFREDSGDMFTRGMHAEEVAAKAEAKAEQLEKELKEERAKNERLAADVAKGGKRLVELRDAVGECTSSLLLAGDHNDPIRQHNEAVIEALFAALAVSGAEVSKFKWAARKQRGGGFGDEDGDDGAGSASGSVSISLGGALGSGKSADDMSVSDALAAISRTLSEPEASREASVAASAVASAAATVGVATATARRASAGVLAPFSSLADQHPKYAVPPLAVTSPRRLASVRERQRDASQLLMDSMMALGEASKLQRKSLQTRLRELCAKLAHRGDASEIRAEIIAELRGLADEDSTVLPIAPTDALGGASSASAGAHPAEPPPLTDLGASGIAAGAGRSVKDERSALLGGSQSPQSAVRKPSKLSKGFSATKR